MQPKEPHPGTGNNSPLATQWYTRYPDRPDATQKHSGKLGVTQEDRQEGACKSLSVCETERESSGVTLSRHAALCGESQTHKI